MQGIRWPDYYPDNCPPEDAEPANGIYYRIVKDCPPTKLDFVPKKLEDSLKLWKSETDKCCACGISLLDNVIRAQETIDRFPKLGDKIASATLRPTHGFAQKTRGEGHHTLWPQINSVHLQFSCVEP